MYERNEPPIKEPEYLSLARKMAHEVLNHDVIQQNEMMFEILSILRAARVEQIKIAEEKASHFHDSLKNPLFDNLNLVKK